MTISELFDKWKLNHGIFTKKAALPLRATFTNKLRNRSYQKFNLKESESLKKALLELSSDILLTYSDNICLDIDNIKTDIVVKKKVKTVAAAPIITITEGTPLVTTIQVVDHRKAIEGMTSNQKIAYKKQYRLK